MSETSVRIVAPRGRIIGLAVVCSLLAALGVVVLVLSAGETLNVVLGVAAISLFGIGGGVSCTQQWRRSASVAADRRGLRVEGGPRIVWGDVAKVGSIPGRLGVRLRKPEAYALASRGDSVESLARSRAEHGGFDLVVPERLLGRPPRDVAAALNRIRP